MAIEINAYGADEAPEQSTGNRIRFQLEFMIMMLNVGRTEDAAEAYNKIMKELDKLA
ncbi:MAG: hypothetical protein ACO2YV_12830 [Pseudomonadales bacterium]